ncbi:hypothetical protein ACJX0J_029748, partial [Zea mays]
YAEYSLMGKNNCYSCSMQDIIFENKPCFLFFFQIKKLVKAKVVYAENRMRA